MIEPQLQSEYSFDGRRDFATYIHYPLSFAHLHIPPPPSYTPCIEQNKQSLVEQLVDFDTMIVPPSEAILQATNEGTEESSSFVSTHCELISYIRHSLDISEFASLLNRQDTSGIERGATLRASQEAPQQEGGGLAGGVAPAETHSTSCSSADSATEDLSHIVDVPPNSSIIHRFTDLVSQAWFPQLSTDSQVNEILTLLRIQGEELEEYLSDCLTYGDPIVPNAVNDEIIHQALQLWYEEIKY